MIRVTLTNEVPEKITSINEYRLSDLTKTNEQKLLKMMKV